jgi:hypothetical protein
VVLKIGKLNKEVSIASVVTGTMPAQKNDGLPFSSRINVLLSFLFMAVSVPLLLWLIASAVAPGWRRLMLQSPLCWGILAISVVLGFSNAASYYRRLKSKLTR